MEAANQIKQVKKIVEKFYEENIVWGFDTPNYTPDQRDHIINIGTSILCTKWDVGYPGGSFVQAVVDNDLMKAVGAADSTNVKALKFYCQLLYNTAKPQTL